MVIIASSATQVDGSNPSLLSLHQPISCTYHLSTYVQSLVNSIL